MDDSTSVGLLNDPVRSALTTDHRDLALGGSHVWRYPPEIGPFGAVSDRTRSSFEALAALMRSDDRVALVTVDPLPVPPCFAIQRQAAILQMILEQPVELGKENQEQITLLGLADVDEMIGLAERTRPGPFGRRTIECGTYLGVRSAGVLIAMAGERMRFDRFVEISAVCVDPECRGRGYAGLLMTRLAQRIQSVQRTPILHVFADNAAAIALYQKLGFRVRQRLYVTSLTLDP